MPHKSLPLVQVSAEELEVRHATTIRSDPQSLHGDTLLPESPCSAIMTMQPVCCEPGDPVDVVARLMVVEDIGAVPVVDSLDELQPIGMVTDRDLTVKVVAEGHDPKSIIVDEIMTRTVLTCMADSPIQRAIDLMAEHQVRRVPIVDAEHRLVGIIAQADIAARLAQPTATAHVVREISQSLLGRSAAPSSSPVLPLASTALTENTSGKEQETLQRRDTAGHTSASKRQAKPMVENSEKHGGATDDAERRASATVNKQTGGKKKRSLARKKAKSMARSSSEQSPKKPASSRTRKTATGAKRG